MISFNQLSAVSQSCSFAFAHRTAVAFRSNTLDTSHQLLGDDMRSMCLLDKLQQVWTNVGHAWDVDNQNMKGYKKVGFWIGEDKLPSLRKEKVIANF